MQPYTLFIKPHDDNVASYYQNDSSFHDGDSGFDLFVTEDVTFELWETKFVDLKIQCEMLNPDGHNVSYYLYPRSSISKSPLLLCNSVGIIDAGYRGNIIMALKMLPDGSDKKTFTLKKGSRIVQICSPTLTPINHKLVNSLTETTRGNNGFGSTGN